MKGKKWRGAAWRAVLVGAMVAGASLGAAGCQGEAEELPPIDVSRPDAGTGGSDDDSSCQEAADHVMGLCASSACAGMNVVNCRQHLVDACEQDLRDTDAVFKYMCRVNAQRCEEALACTH